MALNVITLETIFAFLFKSIRLLIIGYYIVFYLFVNCKHEIDVNVTQQMHPYKPLQIGAITEIAGIWFY